MSRPLRIVIVGAGFAGLCAAVRLKRSGFNDLLVVDRGASVGGTWRDNTYPGAACDVRSHLYSFSFTPRFDWVRPHATQPQILAYLQHTVEREALAQHLRLNTEVLGSEWDPARQQWHVRLAGGEVLLADVLVSGTGALVEPAVPDLPGLADFTGDVVHSARWRHDIDFRGRRVALVGTGASSVQIGPELAPVVDHLTVFQRSAPWVMPRGDVPYGALTRKLWHRLPGLQRADRWRIWLANEAITAGFIGHRWMASLVATVARRHLQAAVPDPVLRERVTPTYAPGCKRILVSDSWYPTLQRDNVSLVTSAIARIEAGAVVTADGVRHAVDTIVLGTGFVTTDFTLRTRCKGRDGADLGTLWSTSAVSYLGISAHGFPNLFTLLGPNTGLGSNSVVFMIEAQVTHLLEAVRHLAEAPGAIEVRADVQARAYAEVQRRMQRTVWASGCHSWYQSAGGRIDTLWPDFSFGYWRRARRFDASVYDRHPAPDPAAGTAPAPAPASALE